MWGFKTGIFKQTGQADRKRIISLTTARFTINHASLVTYFIRKAIKTYSPVID
jgi:hypothetical protein